METGPAPVGGTSPEQVANEVMDTGWHRIANAGKSTLLVVGTQEFVFNGALPEEFHLRSTLASWERRIIEQTLTKTNGSKTEAARRLGLSKSDLSYKLSKYGL
jgi:DNA-binding NtrC family response regulator